MKHINDDSRMMKTKYIFHLCLLFSLQINQSLSLDAKDIVIVIISQDNEYHIKLAENLKNGVQNEAINLGSKDIPTVHLSHIDFPITGDWTILALIPILEYIHSKNISWFIFIDDTSQIRLKNLLRTLNNYNADENIWLGYGLHDEECTIIHHFAFYPNPQHFKYPNVASGVAFSSKLLGFIANRMKIDSPKIDFSIDRSHELAKYIWNDGKGFKLTHEASFCVEGHDNCSTIPQIFKSCDNKPVSKDSVYFAVKTCSKFHKERIPVVLNTWANQTSKIKFFSDVEDKDASTINLGVPNTETGHCAKTMAILKYAAEELERDKDIDWVVLADDDTLLSVPRLRKFLTCYDSTSPLAIGERYGYNVLSSDGYNYITGGGGIVFSRRLVQMLAKPENCNCPSISTPDDMYLGICMAKLGTKLIHSPYFHQARPVDYAKDYLKWQSLISFHKHWMIDPLMVYKRWLLEDDISDDFEDKSHSEL
ncbi:hypothetical protein Trydic_g18136 [Trypoxylus dichotomus]